MPELPDPLAPKQIPPAVKTMLANPEALKRFNESISAMCERAASPLVKDFQASTAKSLAAALAPSMAAFANIGAQSSVALMLERSVAPYKTLSAQMGAKSLASIVGSLNLPRGDEVPSIDFAFSAVPSPYVALSARVDRVAEAVDRNTTMTVSTITTSVAPIASDVASIARPRFHRLRLALQIVGGFVVLVGAAEGLDWIVHEVQSVIH